MYIHMTELKSNVSSWYNDEYPITVHILPSGYLDLYIVVTEDPTTLDSKLLSMSEIQRDYNIPFTGFNEEKINIS